ncbi:hypothetical protein [Thiomicrorhabdus xiamenensis]|uniref:Uncharacterized protein n=1 Tax=Thiomicrorhabdus xiamenensis TaxID=2739063 RepID=A0A7D4SIS3_9GAMM|nr:hypothetical protein [Thiomicrorhabdus xiamenensis]QKI89920.1 hypothetical protein HQN79_10205 [Thiomicrorhabdus xiamenensis]
MTAVTVFNLHPRSIAANIASLTKNRKRQSKVLNSAFFVPKLWGICTRIGMKNRNRISKYGRVNARIKDPLQGKKCSRLAAISDTRPPETKTGGQALLKPQGGQTMAMSPITRATVGQFSFSINLPENSFIKRFIAVSFAGAWVLSIETERGQMATVKNHSTNAPRYFETLDSLALWLASQGVPQMQVMLPNAVNVAGGGE